MIYILKYLTTTVVTFFSTIVKKIFKGNPNGGYPCEHYDIERGQPLDTFPLLHFDEVTVEQY